MLTFSLKHQLLLLILLRYNSRMHKEMTATDVIKFNIDLEKSGIAIWIDGGWGVDALLGKQRFGPSICHDAAAPRNVRRSI